MLSFPVGEADFTRLFLPAASLPVRRDLRFILTSSIHPLLKAVWTARQRRQQLTQEHKHICLLEMEMEKYGCELARDDAFELKLLHCLLNNRHFSFSFQVHIRVSFQNNKQRCQVLVLHRLMVALVALFSSDYFRAHRKRLLPVRSAMRHINKYSAQP